LFFPRGLTDWLSGSSETAMLFSFSRHFWQIAPVSERQSRCPLEPVLGCFFEENISIYNLFVFAANTKYLSRSVLLSQLSPQ
jgi:hypothetical protein